MATCQHIKEEEVLDSFVRGEIYGYILANPGAHYQSIVRNLNLNNGTARHHLRVLEMKGYITSTKDGIYKRFSADRENMPHVKSSREKRLDKILQVIKKNPGISGKGVAEKVGIRNTHIATYLKELKESGSIKSKRNGREVNYSVI